MSTIPLLVSVKVSWVFMGVLPLGGACVWRVKVGLGEIGDLGER